MAEHRADARRRTASWGDPTPVVTGTGRLRSEGRVIHVGSRLATAEARLTEGGGQLYAHAVGTCRVLAAR